MNIDSAVVLRYISPLYDHHIVCDWAKIVSKIGRKFAAFCRSHCCKLACAAEAKCSIMQVSPLPPKSLNFVDPNIISIKILQRILQILAVLDERPSLGRYSEATD